MKYAPTSIAFKMFDPTLNLYNYCHNQPAQYIVSSSLKLQWFRLSILLGSTCFLGNNKMWSYSISILQNVHNITFCSCICSIKTFLTENRIYMKFQILFLNTVGRPMQRLIVDMSKGLLSGIWRIYICMYITIASVWFFHVWRQTIT